MLALLQDEALPAAGRHAFSPESYPFQGRCKGSRRPSGKAQLVKRKHDRRCGLHCCDNAHSPSLRAAIYYLHSELTSVLPPRRGAAWLFGCESFRRRDRPPPWCGVSPALSDRATVFAALRLVDG